MAIASFSAPYLKSIPVVKLDLSKTADRRKHDGIVEHVKRITTATSHLAAAEGQAGVQRSQRILDAARKALDDAVYALYDLDDQEREWVRVKSDLPSPKRSRL